MDNQTKEIVPLEKIQTLNQLRTAAENKKSVYSVAGVARKPIPAAVVLHFQGHSILKMFDEGLFIYTPKSKKKKSQRWFCPKKKMIDEVVAAEHDSLDILS